MIRNITVVNGLHDELLQRFPDGLVDGGAQIVFILPHIICWYTSERGSYDRIVHEGEVVGSILYTTTKHTYIYKIGEELPIDSFDDKGLKITCPDFILGWCYSNKIVIKYL